MLWNNAAAMLFMLLGMSIETSRLNDDNTEPVYLPAQEDGLSYSYWLSFSHHLPHARPMDAQRCTDLAIAHALRVHGENCGAEMCFVGVSGAGLC